MFFILIVLVFMFAFGVSTQALLYPNQNLNTQLLANVFLPAYFIIGGEYYTRDNIMAAVNDGINGIVKIIAYIYILLILNDFLR